MVMPQCPGSAPLPGKEPGPRRRPGERSAAREFEADVKDGVLTLTLPKVKEATARRITVS